MQVQTGKKFVRRVAPLPATHLPTMGRPHLAGPREAPKPRLRLPRLLPPALARVR